MWRDKLTLGKVKKLPQLFIARQSHLLQYRQPGALDWIRSPQWPLGYECLKNEIIHRMKNENKRGEQKKLEYLFMKIFWIYLQNAITRDLDDQIARNLFINKSKKVIKTVLRAGLEYSCVNKIRNKLKQKKVLRQVSLDYSEECQTEIMNIFAVTSQTFTFSVDKNQRG